MGTFDLGKWTPLALVLLSACSQPSDPLPPAAGTVLVVDGVAIGAAAVDAHVDALLDIKPGFTLTHRRRLIVMHWSFPMAYAQALAGSERERASERAAAWAAGTAAGPAAPALPTDGLLEGNWDSLGLDVWLVARQLQAGQTSPIVELPGRFVQIELIERDPQGNPAREHFALRVKSFNYVDDPRTLVVDCMQAKLEIVAPTWREVVPGLYKYKMQAGLE